MAQKMVWGSGAESECHNSQRKVWLGLWKQKGLLCDRYLAQGVGRAGLFLPLLLPKVEELLAELQPVELAPVSLPANMHLGHSHSAMTVWLLSMCVCLCRWVDVKCPVLFVCVCIWLSGQSLALWSRDLGV